MRDVLVIDPDVASAKLAVIVLEGAGFSARAVGSTEAAIAAITAKQPDAIVIELAAPSLGGLDLVTRIKSDPATRDVAVIAVTALDGVSLERLALERGCSAYVRKPIDALRFASVVQSALGGAP